MNLLIKMKQAKDLTPSERQIASFILENPEVSTQIGIKELSDKTYTSTSTVLRMVRKLGIESYIDFRVKLVSDVFDYLKSENLYTKVEPITESQSTEAIIKTISENSIRAIYETTQINEAATFEAIVELMSKYPVIDFYGIGHSNVIAKDAVIKSLRLGIHATIFDDDGSQILASKIANQQRLAFIISYTGESDLVLRIARNLMQSGTPSVSFTSNTNNSLSQLCNYNLFVDTTESIFTIGHMSSRVSMLNLLDILFTMYANRGYTEKMETLKKTYTYKRKEDEE